MKKLFVSVPMRDRSEEDILKSIQIMHKLAEIITGEEFEVLNNYGVVAPEGTNNTSVYCLGEAIKKIALCDFYIGIKDECADNGCYNGCLIENEVANLYGVSGYLIPAESFVCFQDCKFCDCLTEQERFAHVGIRPIMSYDNTPIDRRHRPHRRSNVRYPKYDNYEE